MQAHSTARSRKPTPSTGEESLRLERACSTPLAQWAGGRGSSGTAATPSCEAAWGLSAWAFIHSLLCTHSPAACSVLGAGDLAWPEALERAFWRRCLS